jgi:hypothetical protein
MRRFSILAVFAALSFGCGGAPSGAQLSLAPMRAETTSPPSDQEIAAMTENVLEEAAQTLPQAPWAETHLSTDVVPASIVSAWQNADNRRSCAPIAPIALGAGEGANARVSDFDGGWAVEFDQRGMPGIARNGEPCERCGRGVFGIAGTNMTPADLVSEDSPLDVPEPSFADGSHITLEPPADGEPVAAATLTVFGQGCVYQVWSFLGEDHVRELVSGLRIVDVPSIPTEHVAAR